MTTKEFIENNFDVDGLRECGFFTNNEKTTKEIAKRICSYFGLKTVFEYGLWMHDKPIKANIKTFSEN